MHRKHLRLALAPISDNKQSLFNLPVYVKQDLTFHLRTVEPGAVRLDISEPKKPLLHSFNDRQGSDLLKDRCESRMENR